MEYTFMSRFVNKGNGEWDVETSIEDEATDDELTASFLAFLSSVNEDERTAKLYANAVKEYNEKKGTWNV